MVMPAERIVMIETLGNYLQRLEGQLLEVTESICHDMKRAHDRHCTTYSASLFSVERVVWTISGGNFVIFGPEPFQYAISCGQLHSVEFLDPIMHVRERFEANTERLTTLKAL